MTYTAAMTAITVRNNLGLGWLGAKAATRKMPPPPNKVSQALQVMAGWKVAMSAPGVVAPCSRKMAPIQAKAAANSKWRGSAVCPTEMMTNSETTVAAKVVKVTI